MKKSQVRKMKKTISLLGMTGVMVTGGLGVSYAQWNEQLKITANMSMGKLEVVDSVADRGNSVTGISYKNEGSMAVAYDRYKDIKVVLKIDGQPLHELDSEYLLFGNHHDGIVEIDEEIVLELDVPKVAQRLKDEGVFENTEVTPVEVEISMTFSQANLREGGWQQVINTQVMLDVSAYMEPVVEQAQPAVPGVEVPPMVWPSVPGEENKPQVLPSFPDGEDRPQVLPSFPEAEDSPVVLPSFPEGEDKPQVLPSFPETEDSPVVLPSLPEIENWPVVLPSVPKGEDHSVVLPSVPEAQNSSEALPNLQEAIEHD